MNAWEQARLPRESKRYNKDENRVKTEGARPLPWACHEYPPEQKVSPKLKARLNFAMHQMECALGQSNGGQSDGTR